MNNNLRGCLDNFFPKYLKKYFWDIDFGKLRMENKFFILKRLLEYGDEKAVGWMFKNFSYSDIKYAITHFRGYSRKSLNFWSLMLGVKKQVKNHQWR